MPVVLRVAVVGQETVLKYIDMELLMNKPACAICLVLSFSAGTALAQDDGLSGQVAFGYLATSGNSENENMNLTFGGQYDGEKWEHSLKGLGVKARSSNATTAEAYGLAWKSKYDINENDYVFGSAAWDKDEFSGYDQQIREVVGYGRRFIDRETHTLNAEAGAGFRQADLRDGTSEDESILTLGLDYQWLISETASFKQLFAIESGADNRYTESVTSLSTDVWGDIALVLSYTIKSNSDVPVGTEKTDTFTAISLEYSF
jgi:putative salt-induced outer membrane protein